MNNNNSGAICFWTIFIVIAMIMSAIFTGAKGEAEVQCNGILAVIFMIFVVMVGAGLMDIKK